MSGINGEGGGRRNGGNEDGNAEGQLNNPIEN